MVLLEIETMHYEGISQSGTDGPRNMDIAIRLLDIPWQLDALEGSSAASWRHDVETRSLTEALAEHV
jgi:hypothetical protein